MKVALNLDDLRFETAYLLEKLDELKAHFLKFKVTLFGIPMLMDEPLLSRVDDRPYIQIAMHGWYHQNNCECSGWYKKEDIHQKLEYWERSLFSCLVRGFKGPGWHLSKETIEVLNERGWWVAVMPGHKILKVICPKRCYTVDFGLESPFDTLRHDMRLHGHLQPSYNGLEACFSKLKSLPKDTEFLFIEEIVKWNPLLV